MISSFWLIIAFVCVLAVIWLLTPVQGLKAPVELSGRVSYIIDGDTLIIDGHKPKIRLWGVDAPEKGQTGYKAATDYLFLIAQGQKITCQIVDRDKYGRTVARCFLPDRQEINRMMIKSRKAREYFKYSKGFYKNS